MYHVPQQQILTESIPPLNIWFGSI